MSSSNPHLETYEDDEETTLELSYNEKQGNFINKCMTDLKVGEVKVAVLLGGRGGGKSVTLATILQLISNELPRAKGQFAFTTVAAAKLSLTPGLKAEWNDPERWNLKEYDFNTKTGDYVLWRRPPADWDRPYQEPDIWENCISFPNGCVIEICGYFMNPDKHRGRNDDFAVLDEGLKFKEEWLKVLVPCIRANPRKYNTPLHWLFAVFSTPPYATSGQWMYNYEKLAKEDPKLYHFEFIKTRDNQYFLPPGYIENLRKTLLNIEFQVEVEGLRIMRPPKMFYPTFSRDKHAPPLERPLDFYEPNKSLILSFDFNAHFTSCTAWQVHGLECRNVKALFVKEPDNNLDMSETLAMRVVEYFRDHIERKIVLTGDRNGANKAANVKTIDGRWINVFEEISDILVENGWEVIVAPITFNTVGFERYKDMSEIFAEKDPEEIYLRFHPEEANSTVVSIENTPIQPDYTKNKKSETDGSDQELATHLGDTVDYFSIYMTSGGLGWDSDAGFEMSLL